MEDTDTEEGEVNRERTEIKKELMEIKRRLQEKEKQERRNNIVIKGLEKKEKSLKEITRAFWKKNLE